jgi:hypothetical protein
VIGERAIFLDLVELCGLDQREWIFLAVGNLGLQRGIGFAERDADRRGTEGGKHRDPQRHHRHADLEVREVLRRLDRARARGDLAEAVVPHRLEGRETDLLDIAADVFSDFAIHRRPHLVVAGEGETDAGQRRGRDQRRHHSAGHGRELQRARAQLSHHVAIAAELIVREQVDRDLAVGLGGNRLDGFLQPHVDGVGDRQVVAELQFQRSGLRQDGGGLQNRSGGNGANSGPQKRTTACKASQPSWNRL